MKVEQNGWDYRKNVVSKKLKLLRAANSITCKLLTEKLQNRIVQAPSANLKRSLIQCQSEIVEIFEEFENDIICFSSRGNVITLGDYARTNKLDDFVSSEGSELIYDK